MKRHLQRYVRGNPEEIPGDCVRTVVACILDLELDDVPHFVHVYDHQWELALADWLEDHGILLHRQSGHFVTPFPVMMTGKTKRGTRHAVVGQQGEFVHDPHPSQDFLDGLADLTYCFIPHSTDWQRHFHENRFGNT